MSNEALTTPDAPAPRAGVKDWFLLPRSAEHDGRLVIRYAGIVVIAWLLLAVAGLVFGFRSAGNDDAQAGVIGFGLAVICTFVAWFAARPVVTADRTGVAVLPVFGTRTALRWSEIQATGVRRVRAARGRGQALLIDATDDREIKLDGLWVGLTGSALQQIEHRVGVFADSIGVVRPVSAPDPVDEDARYH
jgi:hypothetical protein